MIKSTFSVNVKFLRVGDKIVTHNGVETVKFVSRVITERDVSEDGFPLHYAGKLFIDTDKQTAVWTRSEAFVALADDQD